jgi:hypothetical protein
MPITDERSRHWGMRADIVCSKREMQRSSTIAVKQEVMHCFSMTKP